MALRLVVLLAVALLSPAVARAGQTPAPAPAGELDVPAFIATLDDLARRARAAETPADGAALADELPPSWTVRAGADRFIVPSAPIADALISPTASGRPWPHAREHAATWIAALRDEAAPLARAGTPPPAHVRRALADVLAAPEFRGRQRYAALEALGERIRQWFRSWWPDFKPAEGTSLPVFRYATWFLAAAAFILLMVLTWRLLHGASRDASERPRPARGVEPTDAGAWAARARDAAAAGDAREAVRCAYHAVLHRLDEDGAWTIAEARTPREYLRLLPAADRRQPAVTFVARLFEGTWYGGKEPAMADAQIAVRHLGDIGCDAQADPAI
jgi:hypothetical protein